MRDGSSSSRRGRHGLGVLRGRGGEERRGGRGRGRQREQRGGGCPPAACRSFARPPLPPRLHELALRGGGGGQQRTPQRNRRPKHGQLGKYCGPAVSAPRCPVPPGSRHREGVGVTGNFFLLDAFPASRCLLAAAGSGTEHARSRREVAGVASAMFPPLHRGHRERRRRER